MSEPKARVVAFRRDFVDLLDGDVLAALMLSQISWFYTPGVKDGKPKLNSWRYGKWWLAKSHHDWFDELGLTQDQSRRCLAKLRKVGLIVTYRMLYKGKAMMHLRLINWPIVAQSIGDTNHSEMGLSPHSDGLEPDSFNKSTTDKSTETKTASLQLAGKQSLTSLEPDKEDQTLIGVCEAPHHNVVEKGLKGTSTAGNVTALGTVWRSTLAEITGKFQPMLKAKEVGQLKELCPILGATTGNIVRWVLLNWTTFAWEVKTSKLVSNVPSTPDVGFLLQYADVAHLLWQADKEFKKEVQTSVDVVTEESEWEKAKSKPKVEHVVVTSEEIAAIMKEVGLVLT